MSKLTVEDTSLVSVADAIRTKGGTTDALIFPDGFVSAIEGIQSGGGGGENYLVGVANDTIIEITAEMLDGCTKIKEYMFYGNTKLRSVVIPKSVKSLEDQSFRKCTSLTSIVIPDGVTSIGMYAFEDCSSLASIVIPYGVTSIAKNTFYNCSRLASAVIPGSVETIGASAFQGCGLTSVNIPNGVVSIESSFSNCKSNTSVIFPESITSIGNYAFSANTRLATIQIKATTPPTLGPRTFYNCSALTQIIVPAGSLSAYKSATNWSAYADLMVEASS